MPGLIQINGTWNTGKTTTATQLAHLFEFEGMKVANLTFEKWTFDVQRYWSENRHHYCLPLECVKGDVEQWLPVGYDVYILEGRHPNGQRFDEDLFANIYPNHLQNVCVPANEYVFQVNDPLDRNLIITKCHPFGIPYEHVAVDTNRMIFNIDLLRKIQVSPKYSIIPSSKTIIAIGYFPGEYFLLFPRMRHYGFEEVRSFLEECVNPTYDLILIGFTFEYQQIAASMKYESRPIISYSPGSVGFPHIEVELGDLPSIADDTLARDILLNQPVGTPLPQSGYLALFNNKYWTGHAYQGLPSVSQSGNILVCNGWIHPKYLIRDGFLSL